MSTGNTTSAHTSRFVSVTEQGEPAALEAWNEYLANDVAAFELRLDHYAMVSQQAWATIGAGIAGALASRHGSVCESRHCSSGTVA